MRKVLIIAHLNPSYGSFRPVPLAKYLPEFGWEPIVLMPPLQEKSDFPFRVIETPYPDILAFSFLKKLFRLNSSEAITPQIKTQLGIKTKRSFVDFALLFGREIFAYPDFCKGWKSFAIKASEEFLQQESVDVVLSSSNPIASSLIASKVKAKYRIPWVADFCDLWSQNHDYHYLPLRKLFDKRLELQTLSKVDALVTVSEPWAEKLRTLHKGKPVYSITHGFDPEEVNTPPANLTTKFTITYTGTIYTGKQDPTKLFAALKDLISDGTMNPDDIEVRFYGTGVVWLDGEIERYGLSDIAKHYERVPKEVAQEKQRESQLLLLLKWEDTHERGVYLGKTFEYLAARRPILAVGGSYDVVSELLDETKAGVCTPTIEDIKNKLKELYREYKLEGKIAFKGEEAKINKYTHKEMARKFSEILEYLARK